MRTVVLAAGESFGILLAIVDPFANVPIFVSLTIEDTSERRRQEAAAIAVLVGVILIVFMLAGEPLLRFFGISLESLQIAGGIVIAVAGFHMSTGGQAFVDLEEHPEHPGAGRSIAFTPMAIPLLAGPGAMGAVAGLEARDAGALKYLGFAAGIIGVAAIVYLCMLFATWIADHLGHRIDALTRVVGLLVLAIGIEMIVHGISTHGALTHLAGP
jgi:multiple antibiotic resistance protein